MDIVESSDVAQRIKGTGGEKHVVSIEEDLVILVNNDLDYVTDEDRRKNKAKGNQKDPTYVQKPMFSQRINRALRDLYRRKYGDQLEEKFDNIIAEM